VLCRRLPDGSFHHGTGGEILAVCCRAAKLPAARPTVRRDTAVCEAVIKDAAPALAPSLSSAVSTASDFAPACRNLAAATSLPPARVSLPGTSCLHRLLVLRLVHSA